MSAENWTALATIVIAVATVVYMAVSMFQGHMMLKGFRLNALLALRDIITTSGTFASFMFLRLYQRIFPRDYARIQKAIIDAKVDPHRFSDAVTESLLEVQKLSEEVRKSFPHRPDPFLGMCADEPELMDEITESIMQAREQHPLRQTSG